jgi:hypothetical protein
MRHTLIAVLLLVSSGLGSACSIQLKNGRRVNFGTSLQQVLVTNNLRTPCILSRNGEELGVLSVGETAPVLFPGISNMVITCKAYALEGGERKYIGYWSQTFYPGYDAFEKRDVVISYVQRPSIY